MTIIFNPYVVAAIFVIGTAALGFFVVGAAMWFMRWTAGVKRPSFKWIDFWLGTTERVVAMSLFALNTDKLPWFIGAWVGLKFAANWKRQTGPDAAAGSMLFLIGNVLSFGYAIGSAALALWLV